MSRAASWSPILRHLTKSRLVTGCGIVLLLIALLALLVPLVIPYTYLDTNFDQRFVAPNFENMRLFGTDELGRDLLARTLLGIRITLLVAVIASVVSLGIGVLYGATAGFIGGKVDAVMMRAVDTLYALPFVFLVILLMIVFERSFYLIFVAIGAINWLDMARIVRGQTISLKHREFVDAARLIGLSTPRIILRHITPNLLGVVLVYMTLTIPQAIFVESFLSFLGLGVQEPQTSLGSLVSAGVGQMEVAPWLLIVPASALAFILFCFNFLGDGLRDIVDPRRSVR